MRTYLVPFKEVETVLVGYKASIMANSQEEAFNMVRNIIADGESPHNYTYIADDGLEYTVEAHYNLGIIEHIKSDCKYNMDDYDKSDVEELNERTSCVLELTAFDIARYGKDELYNMAEAMFLKVGLDYTILEMEMIPIKIVEHFVTYDCIPTEYKLFFSDETYVHMRNGVKIGGNFNE